KTKPSTNQSGTQSDWHSVTHKSWTSTLV
ncbi:L-seryl-tRNA(Sec) selenium transferase, partial [Haemophilus influenzae]